MLSSHHCSAYREHVTTKGLSPPITMHVSSQNEKACTRTSYKKQDNQQEQSPQNKTCTVQYTPKTGSLTISSPLRTRHTTVSMPSHTVDKTTKTEVTLLSLHFSL